MPAPTKIIYVGDSITVGYPDANAATTCHPHLDSIALGSGVSVVNLGVSGKTAAAMDADFPTVVLPELQTAEPNKLVVILAGVNGLLQGTANAGQVTQSLVGIYSQAKAIAGVMVVFGTLTPCPQVQDDIDTINANLHNGATGALQVEGLIDYAAVPTLADTTNQSYFDGDQLHPSPAGQQVMSDTDKAYFASRFGMSVNGTTAPTVTPADPYESDYSNSAHVEVNFKPGAPGPLVATGLGTALAPIATLTYVVPPNMQGGRIVFERRSYPSTDAFVQVGHIDGADANTAPLDTWTDHNVINGHDYEWRAYALPSGDF